MANFLSKEINTTLSELNELEHYVSIITHFQLLLGRVRDLVSAGNAYIMTMEMLLGQISDGNISPNLIPPTQLAEILGNLQSQLPAHLSVPFDTKTELLSYYTHMKAIAVASNNTIIVFTTIPLKDQLSDFSIMTVLNTPIPASSHKNLTATYAIEADHIAINTQNTHFALLTTSELQKCHENTFCSIGSPLYATSMNNLCVIALYLGVREDIDKLCEVQVTFKRLPSAQSLGTGSWLVITQLHFTQTSFHSGLQ